MAITSEQAKAELQRRQSIKVQAQGELANRQNKPVPVESFQAQPATSFLGKARDFAVGITGGGKLAEGLGMALASPGIQKNLSDTQQQASDIQLNLIKAIRSNKAQGKDTSRLEKALVGQNANIDGLSQTQQNFVSALPTNKQVIGSTLRLAGTAAAGAIATGAASAVGAKSAVGFLPGVVSGAKVGALSGLVGGGVQGAGAGLEADQDLSGVLTSTVLGAGAGALTGGVIGGAIGGVSGAISKNKIISQQKLDLLKNNPDSRVAQYTLEGSKTIKTDPFAQEAIKQGVPADSVATIKGANPATKQLMLRQLDTQVKGKYNQKFGALNRPSDVIGDSTIKRYTQVASANKQAAGNLDEVAQRLRGQKVDVTQPVEQFINDMKAMGVEFKGGKPIFEGSDIEGLTGPAGPQAAIERLTKRMTQVSDDAFELHRLKRFIDETVDYGEGGSGLSGRTEGIIKGLRKNIDTLLDTNFPDYNQVNTKYSTTRGALDSFSDAMGTKFNPNNPNMEKLIGTRLRTILSKSQTRVEVLNSLQSLQDVAIKNGGQYEDDLITQVLFANDLEKIFGTSAPTGIAGEVSKGFNQAANATKKLKESGGLFDLAFRATGGAIEGARNINEEAMIKSLKELLSR